MIFEQAYGEWLTERLEYNIQQINSQLACKQYDNVSRKALYSNTDEIAVIVQGGNADTSTTRGVDQNTMPLLVSFICKATHKTTVRNALNNLIETHNVVPWWMNYYDAVKGERVDTRVKSTFSTPMILEENSWPTKSETITVTFIQMAVSVVYGMNAFVSPALWQLKIDGVSYDINSLLEYNLASAPSYDEYIAQGMDRVTMNLLAKSNSFSFTIVRTNGDPLQPILEKELTTDIGFLADKTIVLSAEGVDIPISKHELTETYVKNSAVYVLSLGR